MIKIAILALAAILIGTVVAVEQVYARDGVQRSPDCKTDVCFGEFSTDGNRLLGSIEHIGDEPFILREIQLQVDAEPDKNGLQPKSYLFANKIVPGDVFTFSLPLENENGGDLVIRDVLILQLMRTNEGGDPRPPILKPMNFTDIRLPI